MEQETNNHDARRVPPSNHNNGPYVLIAIGFLLSLAVWKDRVNYRPVVYVEQLLATDDACGGIFYDNRGVPYYYASDPAADTTDPLFYVDTPIAMPSDRTIP